MASLIEHAQAVALETLSDLPSRRAHMAGVAATATSIAEQLSLSGRNTVAAAAWLHDVGYSERVAATGFHPVDGATFVKDQGFPDAVVSLVAYHTGAENEAAERGLSDALAAFERPDPVLLDVLTFSDLTVGPEGERVEVEARITEILSRYPDRHPVNRAVMRSSPALLAAAERVKRLIAAADAR
ncbi:HD domain-containing protein [Sinomonas sp. G460-2]|uniref:HD domain-containing protein n=1 Tax=Sinomonas sp. G460-2 TaxID=3393464 RepID=UPI0039EFBFE3